MAGNIHVVRQELPVLYRSHGLSLRSSWSEAVPRLFILHHSRLDRRFWPAIKTLQLEVVKARYERYPSLWLTTGQAYVTLGS